MTNKTLSQKEFLERLKEIHGNTPWIIGEYKGLKKKIKITNEYGYDFIITASCLLKGGKPNIKNVVDKTNYTKDRFLKVFGEQYNYHKFVYKGVKEKSTITCKIHGDFEINPNEHLSGRGCSKCGNIKISQSIQSNTKDFIEKAKGVHKVPIFGYSFSNYMGAKKPLKIVCLKVLGHGTFTQTPNNHLSGNGCPFCALENKGGYGKINFIKKSKGKISIFYIIRCFSEVEEFYKIGITSNSIKYRYNTTKKMPYSYEVILEIKGKAEEIWDLELKNKRLLKDFSYRPLISFKGSVTECFSNVNLLLNIK